MLAVSACIGIGVIDESDIPHEYPVNLSSPSPYSKTKINVNGTSIEWESDDKIQITAVADNGDTGTSTLTWYSDIEGKDKHYASFSGFVTMTSYPQECYFTYPVRTSTSVDAETGIIDLYFNSQTGRHEPVLYAKTSYDEDGISAVLAHVGAMLEIDVQMDNVSQISFVGNRLESLSPVRIDTRNNQISVSSQANYQITVPVTQKGKVYIAIPPVKLERGFSLVCTNEDESMSMIRSFSSDGGLTSGYDFSLKIGQIIQISLDGEMEPYSVTSSEPIVEHTKTASGLLTGTSVKFTMNKSGISDKMIEEWGATLMNSDGKVVRQISYTNENPISGKEVTLNIANNWKLLPAGTYTFTPFYKIYGSMVTMSESVKTITVEDPGVRFNVHGITSFDRYKNGDLENANKHPNTRIDSVAFSTNVDLSIIDVYSAKINGEDLDEAEVTSGNEVRASYGNLTMTKFQSYLLTSEIKVGELTFSDQKTLHITGLPYEADFTNSDPRNWTPSWAFVGSVSYNNRINYDNSSTEDLLGGVKSPAFHMPQTMNHVSETIPVKTAFYACGCNVDFSIIVAIDKAAYLDIYFAACTANESSVKFGENCVRADYKVAYSNGDYLSWSPLIKLNSTTPSIMYSARSKLYDKALYKIKIHYTK